MGGVRRLFGQISRRAFFGLLAVTLIASQLAFMAPVFALDSTLSGTVTASASNTPINNALVEVLDETGLPVGAANTNSAGFYSISVLAGTYDVRVTPPAGSGLRVSTVNDIDLSTSKIQNFILVQQSEFLYAGTLVDKNGDPLSDWTFRLLTLGGSKADETTTDTLGRFSLSVPANDYLVETTSVSSGQVKSLNRAVTVSSDMANQTLTINKVSFTINVVDTDGNPVSGINAFMNEIFEPTIQLLPNHRTRGLVQQSKTTSGNSVTFDIFPATTNRGNGLSISTTTPGFGDMLIYPFPPVTEDTTITVVMSRKFTYSGVLVDQNGDPMANQTVQALRLNGSRTGEDQTDELGRFGMSILVGDYML